MRNFMKKVVCFLLASVLALGAAVPVFAAEAAGVYTVVWKNWNGAVLETDEGVPYGAMPEYNGALPQRPADPAYTYTFRGWSPAPAAVTADAVYTARFAPEAIEYTVAYELNGGRLQGANQQPSFAAFYEDRITLANAVKNHYTLQWAADGALYNPGSVYTVKGDVTFSAVWTPEVYTVSFVPNAPAGFTASGTMQPITAVYGAPVDLPACGFSVPGHIFVGWRDRAGNPCAASGVMFEENTVLYAVWEPVECVLTFETDGGSAVELSGLEFDYGAVITLPQTARTGADFLGWSLAPNDTENLLLPGAAYTVTGPVTFYAQWRNHTFTVTWRDPSGAVLKTDVFPYGAAPEYTGVLPEKAPDALHCYAFGGWSPAVAPVTENAVYTAVFEERAHRFTHYVYQNDATCTGNGTETALCDHGCGVADTRTAANTATGHTYGAPVWTWSQDLEWASVVFTCAAGDDRQSPETVVTVVITKPASDAESGLATCTAETVFWGVTYTDVRTKTLPPTGDPDNLCKWDNVDHGTSFMGRLTKFFHSVFYFFAHLFGRK